MMVAGGVDDNHLNPNHFYISINDTEGEMSHSHFEMDHPNVLRLWFDDTCEDKEGYLFNGEYYCEKAITEQQAEELYHFLLAQKAANRTRGYAHCTAGIARSGAVGVFVAEVLGLNMKEFWDINHKIQPNPHVLMMLNRNLWKEHFNND